MSDKITKGGTTITRSGGTAQQWQWVQDAVSNCGYDLGLLNANITVQWVDPLPSSSDIGHAHSYMVTDGAAPNFTISIATWADNPGNPNNSGLPDPATDIYDFYQQSFVHELGHVDHFTSITTDAERTAAAGLYWMPDFSGGASNRRYGTLADWSATVWADNIKEAIAETFKVVYYKGRLIYGNRTQWHIDSKDWNALWAMLIPQLSGIYNQQNWGTGHGGTDATVTVPTQFGLQYLENAVATFSMGPISEPNTSGSDGNRFATMQLLITALNDPTLVYGQEDASIDWTGDNVPSKVCGGATWATSPDNGSGDFGVTGASSVGPLVLKMVVNPLGAGAMQMLYYINGDLVKTGSTRFIDPATQFGAKAIWSTSDYPSGDPEIGSTAFSWGVSSSIAPPPYPYLNSVGDMSVGQGLRGAVRLG